MERQVWEATAKEKREGQAHPALLVGDLEACRKKLTAAGVAITPDDSLPGVRRFYAADPFVNRLELIQAEDGFSRW